MHVEQRYLSGVPFSSYQYVDVVFGATPDQDTLVEHSLPNSDPDAVRYEVVSKDRAADIYNDQSATRRPWGAGFVLLRCTVASAAVRLRLFLEPEF